MALKDMKRVVQEFDCMDTLLLYIVGGIVVRILVDLLYIHIQLKYVDKLEIVREDTVLEKIWNLGKIFSQNQPKQPVVTEHQNMLVRTNESLASLETRLQNVLEKLAQVQRTLAFVSAIEPRVSNLELGHSALQERVNTSEDTLVSELEGAYQAVRAEIADLRNSVPAKRASRKKGDTPVEGMPIVTSLETPVEPQQ